MKNKSIKQQKQKMKKMKKQKHDKINLFFVVSGSNDAVELFVLAFALFLRHLLTQRPHRAPKRSNDMGGEMEKMKTNSLRIQN